MKNFVINSLETILSISFILIVALFGIAYPILGIIPGLIIGALITGFGFVLISINDHLRAIREELSRRP